MYEIFERRHYMSKQWHSVRKSKIPLLVLIAFEQGVEPGKEVTSKSCYVYRRKGAATHSRA